MYLSDPLARQFYMQMCYYEHWGTRTLDEKVVVRKIRITTPHGAMTDKTQSDELNLYNLDVIISVGYRIKSQKRNRPCERD